MSRIWVVGIGPGSRQDMTERAYHAMEQADIICGFTTYVELVRPYFPDKAYLSTGMTRETDRCRAALEAAVEGRSVAVISSGDAGIYGMAGLMYQLSADYPAVDMEVVPGVSACLSGGALLGAPLGHDFAVVSLSDLLTPWEVIATRLRCAAQGDFALCLYNPASKRRKDHLQRACDILLSYKDRETLCGWIKYIGREGQQSGLLTLCELRDFEADMFTTVFIGNRDTVRMKDKMVTPRGYRRSI